MAHRISLPDDPELAELVEATLPPALLMLTVHLTGDPSLLRAEWRSPPSSLPAGTLTERQIRELRSLCLARLREVRSSGVSIEARPAPGLLEELLRWALAGDYDPLDFGVLDNFLSLDDDDRRAPQWTAVQLAPGRSLHVLIVGAGLSGLLMGLRLKQAGVSFSILERESGIGGTWWTNTYPNCRVDVPSHLYAYSFVAYDWTAYFAEQPEMLEYLETFSRVYGLDEHIRLGVSVDSASWDGGSSTWRVSIANEEGAAESLTAHVLISAVGQLNKPLIPDFPGQELFDGPAFHSAEWDHSVDLSGKRVGVIGTGASGLQVVPAMADIASEVVLFQRNASWLRHTPELRSEIPAAERAALRDLPHYRAWYRFSTFLPKQWGSYRNVIVDPLYPPTERAVSALNEAMRAELEASLLNQLGPEEGHLAPLVIPAYPPGAKRIVRDDGTWIRSLASDRVRVVTDRIERVASNGIVAGDEVIELDAIIYSTGFRASDFLTPMAVTNDAGVDLNRLWGDDPSSYLGVSVSGFPNFFCLYGPNTGVVVHANLVYFFECQVAHVMEALRRLLAEDADAIEVRGEAQEALMAEIRRENATRAWSWSGVTSWYKNHRGSSPIMWPLPTRTYWELSRVVSDAVYALRKGDLRP